MKLTLRSAWTVAALLVVAALPSSASAQEWKDQINSQLKSSKLVKDFTSAGYTVSHEIQYDLLASGKKERIEFELDAGTEYQIIGKCDNDCTDLDFRLYDPSGDEIGADLEVDDYPLVTVKVKKTGKYVVEVIMADCKTADCGYGMMAMGKGGNAEATTRAALQSPSRPASPSAFPASSPAAQSRR